MEITTAELVNWFAYHAPDEQLEHYNSVREAGLIFARVILKHTPASADRRVAIRKVREAVMTANAAIACGGK